MESKTLDALKRIDFGKFWGEVLITVKDGKAVMVKVSETHKLD